MAALLEINNVSCQFGGIKALNKVSLTIERGDIYGLIGPNGAGKTTLFNCLSGLYQPSSGHFVLAGERLRLNSPDEAATRGIARTFQNIRLFAQMTVLENVMVGCHCRSKNGLIAAITRHAGARAEEARVIERSLALLDYVGIAKSAEQIAGTLAYGDQRRLEIARALASEPKLLALDEPAAGMNAVETHELRQLIERICADGVTVLLIEHDMPLVMGVCHRIAVLHLGERLLEGTPDTVRSHPKVIEAYLGEAVDA